jgi:hypothetical protein
MPERRNLELTENSWYSEFFSHGIFNTIGANHNELTKS